MATPQQVQRRGRWSLILGTLFAFVAFAAVAYASDVDVAVVDVTVPTNSVTLAPGGSGNITINLSVTGSQAGTATFEVYRDWTLSGGTFTGSNPQEFTVGPRAGGDPATTFSATGTVTVAAGQAADGPFTLAVGAFDITNSNATGAKLAAGDASNYQVTVSAPSDSTAPTASPTRAPAANANGWNNTDVTVTWNWSDAGGSGIDALNCTTSSTSSGEGAITLSASCKDLAGNTGSASYDVKVDKTAPTAAASASPAANGHGWNNSDVTVSFNGDDAVGSGIDFCSADVVLSSEGANQSASGTCTDKAGNVSAPATKGGINIDKTAPTNLTFVGGPAAGESYYFGFVPAAPTCTADGAISGLTATGCTVSGYSDTVGPKTMTASATDLAGNTGTATRSYSVLAWTLSGFFQPVDMGTNVFNTVKSGSTVPLKFRVFSGSTELTDISAVKSLSYVKITCSGAAIEDAIEEIAPTGGTLLRYDSTGGQFIYNLKTSGKAGECYRATMTTQDGSKIEANFKLK